MKKKKNPGTKIKLKLFNDVGLKLKKLIKIAYILELIGSVIFSLFLSYEYSWNITEIILIFIISLFACIVVISLLSLFTYGFAEIVDAAIMIQKQQSNINQAENKSSSADNSTSYIDKAPGNDSPLRSREHVPGDDYYTSSADNTPTPGNDFAN